MQNVRSDEQFVGHFGYLIPTVLMEDDQVVDIRAIEEILVFLQTRADESFCAVDIEFLVVLHDSLDVDGSEVTYLRAARIRLAVFLLQHLEPRDGVVREMVEVLHASLDLLLQVFHQFVRFLGVELGDAEHLDLEQFLDILRAHLADELRLERREGFVNELNQLLFIRRVLIAFLLIDAVLDEYLLEGGIEILLLQLRLLYLEFPLEQRLRVVAREFEQVTYRRKDRFAVLHYAAVRRDIDFAVRERIESIYRFVGRRTRRKLHYDTSRLGREVINLLDLDLAFLVGFEDGLDDLRGGGAERYLGDDEGLVVVGFGDARAYLNRTAALAVVVASHVDDAARREVGEQRELLVTQVRQGCIAELVEVMRQDLRVQTYGDTFYALRQQQRELNRQVNRFVLTAVVTLHPLGRLVVKDRLEGKFRQSCLDITGSCRTVTGEDITPVTLAINQQIFLTQLHERIADRRIAVRVVLHRLTDDISYFVELPVVYALHSVQYTTLYRLESILYSRHSTL